MISATRSITGKPVGPNALLTPPEVVVDAMMLTEGRNRDEIVRCSTGRRLSSVLSVRKFVTDRPGIRGYLHAMGKMSGLVSSVEGKGFRCCESRPRTRKVPLMWKLGPGTVGPITELR